MDGTPLVVCQLRGGEPRGAGTILGTTEVARGTPDGYKLLLGSTNTHVLQPLSASNRSYDPVADVMRAAVLDGLAIYGLALYGLALYGREHIARGDIIITNYAGTVGQHLNNVVMYTPVWSHDADEAIAFMVVVMHWID